MVGFCAPGVFYGALFSVSEHQAESQSAVMWEGKTMVEKRSVTHRINRRAFVAGTSAALAMGMLESEAPSQTGGTSAVKLAIEGGEKAVTRSPGSGMRWGDRELKQLQEML
ncbi:MAG TPA: hypothetical protein PKI05_12585, partial [Thermogutta sp.]|nr:hypothetical protein [Thermogutta sp.]